MNKYIIIIASLLLILTFSVKAATLEERVSGRILLKVESKGEAWYVNPNDGNRYYMKDGSVAYKMMRDMGLGITDSDLSKILKASSTTEINQSVSACVSGSLAYRLRGRILLQVQQNGEAWYVDPIKCRAIYLKDGAAAYQIMRYLGLGVKDNDLAKIPTGNLTNASMPTEVLSSTPKEAMSPSVTVPTPLASTPVTANTSTTTNNTVSPSTPTTTNNPATPNNPDPYSRGVADCTNKKNFTMALIFVAKNGTSATDIDRYKDELEYIRNRFPAAFNYATNGLASMSIPETATIIYSSALPANTELFTPDILKEFYKNAPDNYDFVTIYTNVQDISVNASHGIVKNNIKGIGISSTFDNSALFGSKGRLMGINSLGNRLDSEAIVSCYKQQRNNLNSFTFNNDCGVSIFLHETAHQWAAYGQEAVAAYDPSTVSLPLRDTQSHYYYGLTTPIGTYDPFGLADWRMSPDNSVWINYMLLGTSNMKYHPFTLYFMGLLPVSEYGTKYNILQNYGNYNDGVVSSESMQSVYKQIGVNDIINSYGPRSCSAYERVITAQQ